MFHYSLSFPDVVLGVGLVGYREKQVGAFSHHSMFVCSLDSKLEISAQRISSGVI